MAVTGRCAAMGRIRHSERGQATVEFAIAFPVLVVVAVIAVNAMLMFSECAAFDRTFRQQVCVYTSEGNAGEVAALVQSALSEQFDAENEEVSVSSSGAGWGHTTYSACLDFVPTLFGMGLKSEVFGVTLPHLSHRSSITVDVYKPGVLL